MFPAPHGSTDNVSTGPLLLQIGYNILIFSQATNRQCCTEERDVLDTCIFDSTGGSGKTITENRHLQINYPGANNYSAFTYDGNGRRVSIVETAGGTVTSTKQFVWCSDSFRPYQPCEARNAAGAITSQYFNRGQTITGANYFYMPDGLATRSDFAQKSMFSIGTGVVFDPTPITGSIRELTDSSGNIQDQRTYDLFGRVTKVQGSLSSDFQFGGYYEHQPSGLSLTFTRAYNPTLGRFISRDLLGERAGNNLYAYMGNHPELGVDPSGQCAIAVPIFLGLTALEAAGLTIGLGGIAWSAGQIVGGGGGSSGAGAGAGAGAGDINCQPHPCDPPKFYTIYGECTAYCGRACKPEHLANCNSKCLRYYGGTDSGGGENGALPPLRP